MLKDREIFFIPGREQTTRFYVIAGHDKCSGKWFVIRSFDNIEKAIKRIIQMRESNTDYECKVFKVEETTNINEVEVINGDDSILEKETHE